MTLQEILDLVDNYQYQQIRAGETHHFTDISIVIAEGRMFCRRYSFSKRSWYHAFQEDPNGAIRCGQTIIKVHGMIPNDLNKINPKVNKAYLKKYGNRASMMLGEKYMDSTLELVPILSESE